MNKPLFRNWPRILWIVFVLSLPAVIINGFFSRIIKCPACYLFADEGDGLKNYYTLAWYVQHDKGWHFSGMNYPYGENIIYTDNEPLLALTLRWIDQHVIDMDRHVVGTLNMLLLLSLYFSVLLIYKLLRRWEVGKWWALASSLFIIFLSPQLWRIHGHYALAYVCFLPLLFLLLDLLIRSEKKRWVWSVLCGSLVIVMSLTHLYFLLISVVMLSSFFIFWWWYYRKEKNLLRAVLPWLAGVIVFPVFIILGIRHITDTITDRPTEPFGLDVLSVNFGSTFIPFISPFDKIWTVLLHQEVPNFERIAYTGFIGLLMLPVILFFLFRKRDEQPLTLHVKAFLGAAVMTWLMAAGIFYQNGFKFLWEIVPVLKQFRSLGRLGFSFYYLYMIVCSYLLWQFFVRMRLREMGSTAGYILVIISVFWGFESYLNIKGVRDPVFRHNKFMSSAKDDYVPLLEKAGHKAEDFQAILQFPLVAIGNENLGVARGFWTFREGIHVSFETGLPMIDYAMSRTSVSQGLDIIELISSPYFEKKRTMAMDTRPLLLVCEEEFVIPAERRIISMAEKIGTYQSITLYSLDMAKLKMISLPTLPVDKKDVFNDGFYNGFDEIKCDTTMTGSGALPVKSVPALLWSYTDTSKTQRQWEVSFWSHVDNRKGTLPVPRFIETDPNGQSQSDNGQGRERIAWSEVFGEWIQIALPLTTKGAGYKYELYIDNTGPVIDNLLVRLAGDTCILHFPEMILYNNVPIPN
ncbi:MAG TPA: hypothetical protein VFG10_08640 [Saprospiraceae bacterium]|nr:hypothetical protein [Saprospiraceae bacterium]